MRLARAPRHQGRRRRRIQQVVGEKQAEEQHPFVAGAPRHGGGAFPVRRLPPQQLGQVADPAQLPPAVLGAVGAEEEQQRLRREHLHLHATERHLAAPRLGTEDRVEGANEVALVHLPVQLHHHLGLGVDEQLVMIRPMHRHFRRAEQHVRALRGVALGDEDLSRARDVGFRHQDVQVAAEAQHRIPVGARAQHRAFEGDSLDAVHGEDGHQFAQFASSSRPCQVSCCTEARRPAMISAGTRAGSTRCNAR